MEMKVVVKIAAITDDKSRRKAMQAVAEIHGINFIAVDMKEQKLTVIGDMDTVTIAKRLKKFGTIDIVSVGPAKELEQKDEKKWEEKDAEKKEEKNDEEEKDKKGK